MVLIPGLSAGFQINQQITPTSDTSAVSFEFIITRILCTSKRNEIHNHLIYIKIVFDLD